MPATAPAAAIPTRYADRLRAVREAMNRARLDAFFVTRRVDQYYLTGFTGEDGGILITPRRVYLLTDGRFDENADREAPWATKVIRKQPLPEAFGKLLRRVRADRIGIQPGDMTLETYRACQKHARPARLVAAPPIVEDLRRRKSPDEIEAIRKSLEIMQDAFRETVAAIRPGQTELDIAARLEMEMKTRGSTAPAFPTIVAEGPNASLPHAVPGTRRVDTGSAILIDWGATWNWYASDLTRVVFLGKPDDETRHIYNIVRDAQLKAIDAIRAGAHGKDIDAIARNHIEQAGYGKYFGHGLGHGLGLMVHEPPRLSFMNARILEEGNVVTVEPGIYLPGRCGVRIEDDVLVKADGCEVLSWLSSRLEDWIL